jgi:hypothetical protein
VYQILEKGDIYFFVRPKEGVWEVGGLEEIDHFYLVLKPQDQEIYRLLISWQKSLPRKGGEAVEVFTEMVTRNAEEIKRHLESKILELQQERRVVTVEEARPVGEGRYGLIRKKEETWLIYLLELPKRVESVQRDFNLFSQGAFRLRVKNPGSLSEGFLEIKDKPPLPGYLASKFDRQDFISPDNPDFFNYPNVTFVLKTTPKKLESEGLERELDREEENLNSAEVFNDLKIDRADYPIKPLIKGEWD